MNFFKRALISVSDKTGLETLVKTLWEKNVEIISTGGTAATIKSLGGPVTGISEVTKFPEILNGRVKTLHPAVHGGILAVQDDENHRQQLIAHGIEPIDLVVVNLYPFRDTLERYPDDHDLIIENIDIGGPCLIRAAAKNHRSCLVVTDPIDYQMVIQHLKEETPFTQEERKRLAAKAFALTCKYDYLIQSWMNRQLTDESLESLPDHHICLLERQESLRYGENPHQNAAVYTIPGSPDTGVLSYHQHSGKALSFNNLLDLNAAWEIAAGFEEPAATVIKHQNPCGAARAETLPEACEKALAGDPMSAFGGIVAVNKTIDIETASLLHKTHFLEVIAAPGFTSKALQLLRKKKNRRIIELIPVQKDHDNFDIRLFHNGALIQNRDNRPDNREEFTIVTRKQPSDEQWKDLLFAWQICRFVKSNAIVFAKNQMLMGTGAGQMSRVDSVQIAAMKARDRVRDGVMASDAFFPFRDGVEAAIDAGITAVIQPGGSKGDEDVIAACDEAGITMVFTGIRHFKH